VLRYDRNIEIENKNYDCAKRKKESTEGKDQTSCVDSRRRARLASKSPKPPPARTALGSPPFGHAKSSCSEYLLYGANYYSTTSRQMGHNPWSFELYAHTHTHTHTHT